MRSILSVAILLGSMSPALADWSGAGAGFASGLPDAQARWAEVQRAQMCVELMKRGEYPPACAVPAYVAPAPVYQAPQRCYTLPINRGAAGTAYVTRCD